MQNDIIKRLKNFTVLYAEDEAGLRNNVSELLSLLFKKVHICSDGVEAYEKYRLYKPDLVITDIKMTQMDGMELIRKIRKIDTKIHILVTSAYTEVDYMLEAVELGLMRYIVKPITEEKLFDALKKFIESMQINPLFTLCDEWEFDPKLSLIKTPTQKLELTKKESKFLQLLLQEDKVATYEEIESEVWDDAYPMTRNAMRLLAKNLRKKLPDGALKNIQGVGYRFECPSL